MPQGIGCLGEKTDIDYRKPHNQTTILFCSDFMFRTLIFTLIIGPIFVKLSSFCFFIGNTVCFGFLLSRTCIWLALYCMTFVYNVLYMRRSMRQCFVSWPRILSMRHWWRKAYNNNNNNNWVFSLPRVATSVLQMHGIVGFHMWNSRPFGRFSQFILLNVFNSFILFQIFVKKYRFNNDIG